MLPPPFSLSSSPPSEPPSLLLLLFPDEDPPPPLLSPEFWLPLSFPFPLLDLPFFEPPPPLLFIPKDELPEFILFIDGAAGAGAGAGAGATGAGAGAPGAGAGAPNRLPNPPEPVDPKLLPTTLLEVLISPRPLLLTCVLPLTMFCLLEPMELGEEDIVLMDDILLLLPPPLFEVCREPDLTPLDWDRLFTLWDMLLPSITGKIKL